MVMKIANVEANQFRILELPNLIKVSKNQVLGVSVYGFIPFALVVDKVII